MDRREFDGHIQKHVNTALQHVRKNDIGNELVENRTFLGGNSEVLLV